MPSRFKVQKKKERAAEADALLAACLGRAIPAHMESARVLLGLPQKRGASPRIFNREKMRGRCSL